MTRECTPINWTEVEKRMEAGCSAKEIAGFCRIDPTTFTRRFKDHYGDLFANLANTFYSAGDSNIRYTQYTKAIAGNVPMLMLLGRERLGQDKEKENTVPNEEAIIARHKNMLLEAELQELKQKIEALEAKE